MQEIGETRTAMAKSLMKRIEGIIDDDKTRKLDKYWVLVHAKPYPNSPKVIKQKLLIMDRKPSMMLSCMLFEIDNKRGKLMLNWALPGSWPTWAVEGANEPVPETLASYDRLERKLNFRGGR